MITGGNIFLTNKEEVVSYSVQIMLDDETLTDIKLIQNNKYRITYLHEGNIVTNTGRLSKVYQDVYGAIQIVLDISTLYHYDVHFISVIHSIETVL